jgi:SAM-dependent methyltransferase
MSKIENSINLNLGCGACVVDGWMNVDCAVGARMVKIPGFRAVNRRLKIFAMDWDSRIILHDLTKRFPWKDDSVDIIYSSHTLEHFSAKEGRLFISECFRVLKVGGIIRLLVPDLSHIVLEYTKGRLRADEFLEELGVILGSGRTGIAKRLAPFIDFPHKCMYDETTLIECLREIGFDAMLMEPFESAIGDIEKIEQRGRTEHAVIVEAHKY